jgi:hypothetical protein
MTVTRTHQLLTAGATACLGGALFVGLAGLPFLARACESPLEFVGTLISNVHHHISLDQLDPPTYPRCF